MAEILEIPRGLMDEDSPLAATKEGRREHKLAYDQAVRLGKALSEHDQEAWTVLPGSEEEVTLDKDLRKDDNYRLFGKISRTVNSMRQSSQFHLATFAVVKFINGDRTEGKGVSREKEVNSGLYLALPVQSEEFQFVKAALGKLEESAIAEGILTAREEVAA